MRNPRTKYCGSGPPSSSFGSLGDVYVDTAGYNMIYGRYSTWQRWIVGGSLLPHPTEPDFFLWFSLHKVAWFPREFIQRDIAMRIKDVDVSEAISEAIESQLSDGDWEFRMSAEQGGKRKDRDEGTSDIPIKKPRKSGSTTSNMSLSPLPNVFTHDVSPLSDLEQHSYPNFTKLKQNYAARSAELFQQILKYRTLTNEHAELLHSTQAQISTLKTDVLEFSAKASTSDKEVLNLRSELRMMEDTYIERYEQLQGIKDRTEQESQAAHVKLANTHRELLKKHHTEQDLHGILKSQFRAMKGESSKTTERAVALETQNCDLQRRLDITITSLERAGHVITDLTAQKTQYADDYAKAANKNVDLEAQLRSVEAKLEIYQRQNLVLHADVQRLRNESSAHATERAKLAEDNGRLKDKLETSPSHAERFKHEADEQDRHLLAANNKISDTAHTSTASNVQEELLAGLPESLRGHVGSLLALLQEKDAVSRELGETRQKVSDMQSIIDKLSSDNEKHLKAMAENTTKAATRLGKITTKLNDALARESVSLQKLAGAQAIAEKLLESLRVKPPPAI